MSRRCIHDILARICQLAQGRGVGVTDIYYGARLSGAQYRKHVERAVSIGLIESSEGRFKLSVKGKKYLQLYNQMQELFLRGSNMESENIPTSPSRPASRSSASCLAYTPFSFGHLATALVIEEA